MVIRNHGYGRNLVQKMKRKNEKTMVGFGRTEKSLSLSCTEFRALSHGHGFRDPCFNGVRKSWVFHDFLDRFFWTTSKTNWETLENQWKSETETMENQWKTKEKRGGCGPTGPPGSPPLSFPSFSIGFPLFLFHFSIDFPTFPNFLDNHDFG